MKNNNIRNYIYQNEFKITLKNNKIDIENYTDIGLVCLNEIIIYNKKEKIKITGKNLSITKLLNNEILITGKYQNISLETFK